MDDLGTFLAKFADMAGKAGYAKQLVGICILDPDSNSVAYLIPDLKSNAPHLRQAARTFIAQAEQLEKT